MNVGSRAQVFLWIAGGGLAAVVSASDKAPAAYAITPVPAAQVRLTDDFWSRRVETNRTATIPFGFRKSTEEGRLRNFERAAGRRPGPYEGKMPFDDTDVYKLVEGAALSLESHPDPELDRYLDGIIAIVAAAQEPDGYLTTYKTIDATKSPAEWLKPGPRWDLELEGSHELYNAGHLYEAAHAHFRATGKRSLLAVAVKNADLLDRVFGPGRRTTPPGHQIVETGLFKLAEATGEARYGALGRFFLEQRGRATGRKLFGTYNQDHLPVLEQTEAVGHAVRAAYMYAAMVDAAVLDQDARYLEAGRRIWKDVVTTKLYVTGGLGALRRHEGFGAAYELPNRSAYSETCAAIANAYWAERLFRATGDGEYMDVLERSLYNTVLAGVSLTGDTFFYPNPLEADGKEAFNHGAPTRQPWFDSSCCPTNLARFLPAVPGLAYAVKGDILYVNLYAKGEATVRLGPTPVGLRQETDYPWQGLVRVEVRPGAPRAFELRLRVPGWAREQPVPSDLYTYLPPAAPAWRLTVNGVATAVPLESGYVAVRRTFQDGDVITLDLPMPVRRVIASERVADDRGKVALERGPLVYAVEGIDHGGSALDLVVPDGAAIDSVHEPDLLGGVTVLRLAGQDRQGRPRPIRAVPYYAWSHRGPGEMAVWLARRPRPDRVSTTHPQAPSGKALPGLQTEVETGLPLGPRRSP